MSLFSEKENNSTSLENGVVSLEATRTPQVAHGQIDHPEEIPAAEESGYSTSFARKYGRHSRLLEKKLAYYHIEARGIRRVEFHEKHGLGWQKWIQPFILWVSVNLAAQNTTLGMLGPATFDLSFKDSALCAVFGCMAGSMPVAYIATFGPPSGNRTMVLARYTMGWWPNKLIVILNLIIQLGYSMIDLVVAGQILSATSTHGSLPVVVGIIIIAILTWVVTLFGIKLFHAYERWAFLPQLICFSILYGVAGSKFDLVTPSSGNPRTIIGNRLSFFSICFSAAITYSPIAADFFVYYPTSTPRVPIFVLTLVGLCLSFSFSIIVGVGLASGVASHKSFSSAYDVSQGALLVAGYESLHGFGKFCSVVMALGLVANAVAPTYASGLDFQVLGRAAESIPRFVWNSVGILIYTVCALAGRDHLSEIFQNFLALMGYWVAIWITLTIEEQVIFRRIIGYDWAAWNQQMKLPVGIAALIAFLVGWAGAILCMAQVWYIGPIAAKVGEYGADMGSYVGLSWAALVYPPLRWLELRKFQR